MADASGFPTGVFDRIDGHDDADAYRPPRLVTHLDEGPSPPWAASPPRSEYFRGGGGRDAPRAERRPTTGVDPLRAVGAHRT